QGQLGDCEGEALPGGLHHCLDDAGEGFPRNGDPGSRDHVVFGEVAQQFGVDVLDAGDGDRGTGCGGGEGGVAEVVDKPFGGGDGIAVGVAARVAEVGVDARDEPV